MPERSTALRRYLEVSQQPASSSFHTSQISISFGEIVDASNLFNAWETVARVHAALRTTFGTDDALAIAETPLFDWQVLDWKVNPPVDIGAEWQSLVQSDATTPIASEAAPPCRFTLIHLPNGDGHMLWSFHGALLDHDSISAILHQWLRAYDSLRIGEEAPSFTDDPAASSVESFDWKAAFEDFKAPRPLIVLPLPKANIPSGTRRSISRTFERPERIEFAASAATMNADLRSLFSAAWAFVVTRATTSDGALVLENLRAEGGIGRIEAPVTRWRRVEIHTTSGDLVRSFSVESPFLPLEPTTLAQALNLASADIDPATAFVYRALTLNDRLQLEMPRWMAADAQLMQQSPAPITLRVVACDRPEVSLDYDPAVLSDAAARLLFDLFLGTLAAFVTDSSLRLSTFALPGKPASVEGTEAPATFRSLVPQKLHELFADVATESPDAIAVEMGSEKLTFAQLNNAANQLARHLRKNGVEAGARVGISMPRSPRWITALLGTLKAGASIVPFSETATVPAAGIKVWLVDTLLEDAIRDLPVIQLHTDSSTISGEKFRGVPNESALIVEALTWVDDGTVHTFTHEALGTALQSTAALLGLIPTDRVLQFAHTGSFSAVEEVLTTLLSGATLILQTEPRWATRTAVQEFVQESEVTALSIPTPFWSQWTHYLAELSLRTPETLRVVAIYGGLPSPNAVSAWRAAAGKSQLLHRIPAAAAAGLGLVGQPISDDPSFLGQPGPDTIVRLVDARGLQLPAGLPGRPEIRSRTKDCVPIDIESFVAPEGTFHARATLQAMVAGPSNDVLAESIRLAATTHPEVIDAHTDQRLIAARQEWCLWIVPRDSQRGEPHDFRDWLASRLPALPRRIRALPRLPLTEAGHVDLAALADLLPEDGSDLLRQKGTEDEERLRKTVSRILGGRRIELDEIISEGRTKSEIAKLLHEAVMREEPRVEFSDFTTGFSIRSLLRNVRGRKSGVDSKWTPIQPLRASGTQPPLIFIHDLDGTAKPYASLVAHLGDDQPCYAITARGLADPSACHASISEMTNTYIEALRVFDANGPYRLVGHGFGGLVAFEMARQLTATGAEVALLVLLASEPPSINSTFGFLTGGWKRSLPHLFGKKSVEETNSRRRTQDTPAARTNQEAARKYSATPAALQAHVFAPTSDFPSYRSVQNGWEACCGEVLLYQVPCSASAMMEEPAVESLAEVIFKLARAEDLNGELES